jgi:hypothetical protein
MGKEKQRRQKQKGKTWVLRESGPYLYDVVLNLFDDTSSHSMMVHTGKGSQVVDDILIVML